MGLPGCSVVGYLGAHFYVDDLHVNSVNHTHTGHTSTVPCTNHSPLTRIVVTQPFCSPMVVLRCRCGRGGGGGSGGFHEAFVTFFTDPLWSRAVSPFQLQIAYFSIIAIPQYIVRPIAVVVVFVRFRHHLYLFGYYSPLSYNLLFKSLMTSSTTPITLHMCQRLARF